MHRAYAHILARSHIHTHTLPTDSTKGVIVWTTVYGNVVCGPTAEEQESRSDRSNDPATIAELRRHAEAVVPGLAGASVVGTYSGIRPATEHRDYQITSLPAERWITVGGIRSTGLTAAPGIAEYVADLHALMDASAADLGTASTLPAPHPNILPPYLPSAPLAPQAGGGCPPLRNDPAPSLNELCDDYCARSSGAVHVFDGEYLVTHPLSVLGMSGDTDCLPAVYQ